MQAVQYFREVTAPGLSLYFDDDFWTVIVSQMGEHEPAVKYAVAAVGALSREGDRSQNAVALYNKALSTIRKPPAPKPSPGVVLVTSVLFICFEMMRCNSKNAIKHLQGAAAIAMNDVVNPCQADLDSTVNEQAIARRATQFLYRVVRLAPRFSQPEDRCIVDLFANAPHSLPEKLCSIEQARCTSLNLVNRTNFFLDDVKQRSYRDALTPRDEGTRQQLLQDWTVWTSIAEDFVLCGEFSARDVRAAQILRMRLIIYRVAVSKYILPEECAYDDSLSQWEVLVILAEAVLASEEGTTTFLFDADMVTSLYHTACKCRHPKVRRRALSLLRSLNRLEGSCDSRVVAAVVARIIALEETNLEAEEASTMPPERDRIHDASLETKTGKNGTSHLVTFYQKPNGVNGPWKIWVETVPLE